ncbi:MAG: FadR/GntR family transcriptional regulator [Syntrophales bacterium]
MFKKISQNRMYETIVDQVFESIMRGDLKPNDKLPSEHELCGVFGVSRVTIREAIRALEQYGIVEVRQGSLGGSYIKSASLNNITEQIIKIVGMADLIFPHLSEARIGIECAAINQLKRIKISQEEFAELENNMADAERFFKQGKEIERLRCNFGFHSKLVAMSKNPIYIVTHNVIVHSSTRFFESVHPTEVMVRKTLDEHREMVRYMKRSDFKRVCEICESHIRGVEERIIEKSKGQSKLLLQQQNYVEAVIPVEG